MHYCGAMRGVEVSLQSNMRTEIALCHFVEDDDCHATDVRTYGRSTAFYYRGFTFGEIEKIKNGRDETRKKCIFQHPSRSRLHSVTRRDFETRKMPILNTPRDRDCTPQRDEIETRSRIDLVMFLGRDLVRKSRLRDLAERK